MELDRIYCADARHLREVDDGSVQLIVTSPPYNVGKNYSQHHDAMELREYLAFLKAVWKECDRVLARGGRIAINVANTWRKPYLPLNAYISHQLIELGLWMRGEIIWDKGPCLSGNTKVYVRDTQTGTVTCRRISDLHDYGTWKNAEIEALDDRGKPCWKPIANLWETKEQFGQILTFSDGSAVTATANHRFPKPDGALVRVQDLRIGDHLKRSRHTPEFEGRVASAFSCTELAWSLGLFLAEGSFGKRASRGLQSITYTLHKDEQAWIERLQTAWEPFGCTIAYTIRKNKLRVTVSGKLAGAIVQEFITGDSAHSKLPLNSVLSTPRDWREGFLQGWLDGDGHWNQAAQRWEGNITGANQRLMPVLRALTRSLDYRFEHKAGWATADKTGKRYGIIRWKLYRTESTHHNAVKWDHVEIKEIAKRSGRFFDLALPSTPHLFVLANGVVTHNSAGISTAWGSFARASNPTLRDVHEYILVFSKESWKLEETRGKESGIENLEFVEWTKSVWRSPQDEVGDSAKTIWRFDTQSKRRNGKNAADHPAPFPLDLPLRLILLYTNVGDVILDPFMGSGTSALAAKMTQRHYIGYDISSEYVAMANERLAALEQPRVIEERIAKKRAAKK